MNLRDALAPVLARNPRYSIHAYAFIFEAVEYTKKARAVERRSSGLKGRRKATRHVTGRQLSEGACAYAREQYGLLARVVLGQWGVSTTSDLGEIVYNLIASGDLEKSPSDSRSDFDDIFDLQAELGRDFPLALDDVA